MHALRLKATNCRGGTRVSLSRLPAVLQVAPVAPPLLAVIASGLGTPHGSRKQRSHFTSWYAVAHSGVDDACFTPRRARIFHTSLRQMPWHAGSIFTTYLLPTYRPSGPRRTRRSRPCRHRTHPPRRSTRHIRSPKRARHGHRRSRPPPSTPLRSRRFCAQRSSS